MASILLPEQSPPGFVFENCQRNAFLVKKGVPAPKTMKTGTTICGVIYKDGVILGADTRASSDTIVSEPNCLKLHYMSKNIYCCGAGTAADADVTGELIRSQLQLHHLSTGRENLVVTANRMLKQMLFRYQGYISAAMILAGVDHTGPSLYQIYPHGSSNSMQYTSMGSGSLAAMSFLEAGWKPDMNEEEGKKLVRDAIAAGILNDLGSGGTVNMCVIKKGALDYLVPYEKLCVKGTRLNTYQFKPGTTALLSTQVIPLVVEKEEVRRIDQESMDTSS
ncbi:proteasome subunit beta type-7 [Nilaparvata lugens]|uniref:proteasome subunit beta type-7 n=1 Tax=Nilaparvata lugens TaxID=108931 RepID=UPI00193D3910|nr:proteasome subunit beta type-7 [Nilaparvata lugens]